MKYELRGIIRFYPDGRETINLIIRDKSGGSYQTFEYPPGEILNHIGITTYLAKMLTCDPAEIIIPEHIKIPKEKKK